MIDRIVEISNPARLHIRDSQLVIEPEAGDAVTTPVNELAVLLIAHQRVAISIMATQSCELPQPARSAPPDFIHP
jgi:hypothetical protein